MFNPKTHLPPSYSHAKSSFVMLRKILLCLGFIACFNAIPLGAAPIPPTDNTSAPYMGFFEWSLNAADSGGWNYSINRSDYAKSWLYRTNAWVEDFCGSSGTSQSVAWGSLAMPSWITTGGKNWLTQNPGGTLVITMGMFPSGYPSPDNYSSCISGTYSTSWYTTAANRLVAAGLTSGTSGTTNNVIIRLGHEFNAGYYPWHVLHSNAAVDGSGNKYDDRPENYVALWQKIVTTMKAVAPNLKFCWNGANNWVGYTISDAYPGDAYVDYVATDVYDQAWLGTSGYPYSSGTYPYGGDASTKQQNVWNNWIYPASPQNGILAWKNIAVAHGKPFAIGEWGVCSRTDGQGGIDAPYFIQQMYNFIQDPANNVAFHIYFDVPASDGGHQLTSFPSMSGTPFPHSATLFRQLFGIPLPVNNDIGTTGVPGSNDAVTVNGAGAGFLASGTSDSFYFSSKVVTGDTQFVAEITAMESGTAPQSGIMLRQSTTTNAPYAALFLANGQCIFQSRTTTGAAAGQGAVFASGTLPVWLKMVRSGSSITGYQSTDGLNWNYAGAQTIAMTGTNYSGVAVSSGSTSALNTTSIDNVDNYDIDVANTASIGNSLIMDDTDATGITKTGAWSSYTTPAGFYGSDYLWLYHGSALSTIKYSPTITTAGLYNMYMRWDVTPNRSSNVTTNVVSASGTTPLLCNQYTGGYLWNYLGTYSLASGTSNYVFISSTAANGYAVTADAVMFVPVPTAALPPPKVDNDVGSPSTSGTATYSGGVYSVKGAGTGIAVSGTSDQFNFVNQNVTTDQTLIARVTGLTYTVYNAKGGVMIRDSLAANSPYVMTDVSPGGWAEFYYRTSTGAGTAYTVSTGITPSPSTPIWVKLVKSGNLFTGYYATTVGTPGSSDWHSVGTISHGVSSYQAGLIVTSAVSSTLATGTFDNVSP